MVPDRLHFTGDGEADALLAEETLALLIGFALDQQVTVPTAFAGPLKLKQRLGTLDATTIAETDPARLEEAFREKPAIHRFPGSMATRVQDLCAVIVEDYGGEAERVWTEAADGADLKRRRSSSIRRRSAPTRPRSRSSSSAAVIEIRTLSDGGQTPAEIAAELEAFLAPARRTLELALYDVRLTGE